MFQYIRTNGESIENVHKHQSYNFEVNKHSGYILATKIL